METLTTKNLLNKYFSTGAFSGILEASSWHINSANMLLCDVGSLLDFYGNYGFSWSQSVCPIHQFILKIK